jgi:hypothetical protein
MKNESLELCLITEHGTDPVSIGKRSACSSHSVVKQRIREPAIRDSWFCGFQAKLALLFDTWLQADFSNSVPHLPNNDTSERSTLFGNAALMQYYLRKPHGGFTLIRDSWWKYNASA